MLKQRIATGLVLVALFLAALFTIPAAWFSVIVGLIVLAAAWEWSNLASLHSAAVRWAYVAGTAILLALGGCYLLAASRYGQTLILGSACLWWLIALLWVAGFPATVQLWGNRWVKALMGWLVLIPPWLAIAILLGWAGDDAWPDNGGRWVLLMVVVIVVLMDTGGYVVGRLFGRRKLAPQVSPGKTWAGFTGGLGVNGVLLVIVGWQPGADIQRWLWLALLIAATACASVLGDLLESMVKRQRNIKDSGVILPGHGGILDRVDGMTAAFPVFALLYLLYTENGLGGLVVW